MSRHGQLRRVISVVTLTAQLLGLLHLAFDAHTLTATGTVVDAAHYERDAHDEAHAHLCEAASPALQDDDAPCAAAACWTQAGLLAERPQASRHATPASDPEPRAVEADVREEVLRRAPKGSPPAA